MKTALVFNVGSSSVKCAVFHGESKIFSEHIQHTHTTDERIRAVKYILLELAKQQIKPDGIGHRIVHGGTLTKTTLITSTIRKQLNSIAKLAPLHDIPELEVVDICSKLFDVKQYAVFDTAFHQTIPAINHRYAIPEKFYKKGIRKYGFHGISHEFISRGFKGNVITCHLGSGCSICAIQNGKSIQTSMGFTPLDGLIMTTRSGSIDPGVIFFLKDSEHMSVDEINHMLNKESGLLAIGGANDVRILLKSKSPKAKLAIDMYIERIVQTIGSYIAALGSLDTLIFSAGTGEGSDYIRAEICKRLAFIGVKLDFVANKKAIGVKSQISSSKSDVQVHVVPTNEELAIVQKIIK